MRSAGAFRCGGPGPRRRVGHVPDRPGTGPWGGVTGSDSGTDGEEWSMNGIRAAAGGQARAARGVTPAGGREAPPSGDPIEGGAGRARPAVLRCPPTCIAHRTREPASARRCKGTEL
ncbi:hypothetical protein GCM10009767_32050 [Kocuria aegyptia]|uniref:Uncharacterized protein n=1 Tax=Kocuria aegyptia TaxID=330943 RepID=A0ABN2L1B2_9MICC